MLVKKFTKREQDVDVIRGVRKASSVTPSDSDHLVDPDGEPLPTRSVYVGVSGDLSVVFCRQRHCCSCSSRSRRSLAPNGS